MIDAQTRIYPIKRGNKILWNFEIPMDFSNLTRRTDLVFINKKKESIIWWILQFQQTTEKENKKIDKYLDLA